MTGLNTLRPARNAGYKMTQYIRLDFDFTAVNGAALIVGTLPGIAVIHSVVTVVKTAFNAGTANTLAIGTAGSTTGLAATDSLTTVGRVVAGSIGTSALLTPAVDTTYQVIPTLSGTAPTTGAASVIIEYTV